MEKRHPVMSPADEQSVFSNAMLKMAQQFADEGDLENAGLALEIRSSVLENMRGAAGVTMRQEQPETP